MQGTLRGALLLALLGAGSLGRPRPGTVNRHIILVDDAANLEACTQHAVTCGAEIHRVLPLMNGFVCTCPGPAAVRAIMGHPAVEAVEPDTRVPLPRVSSPLLAPPLPPGGCVVDRDLVPWGINRIGTLRAWRRSRGEGVKVAIIDTGVDTRHPDLVPNLRGGVNLINPGQPPEDDSGHGTHVAGILAAADNCSGVVGVAPRCELYAVKAFDRHGLGATSDVLTALQWCADFGMQVVKATCSEGSSTALPFRRRFRVRGMRTGPAVTEGGEQQPPPPATAPRPAGPPRPR